VFSRGVGWGKFNFFPFWFWFFRWLVGESLFFFFLHSKKFLFPPPPPPCDSKGQLHAVLRIRIHKYPKPLPSRIRIRIRNKLMNRIQIRNKLMSRIRIRIRNYHWGSGLLKKKCSDINTIFSIKSLISAQK